MSKTSNTLKPPGITEANADGSGQLALTPDIFSLIASPINRIIDPISRYLSYTGAYITFLMALGMVVDLVSRFLFRHPLSAMIEYQTFMLVIMGFLSMAYTMLQDEHVSVDIISSKLPEHVNSFLHSIFSIWGMYTFLIISWQSFIRAGEAFGRGEVADISGIPYTLMHGVVAVGTLLLALVLFTNIFKNLSILYQHHRKYTTLLGLLFIIVLVSLAGLGSAPILKLIFGELGRTAVGILYISFMMIMLMLGFPVAFSMAFTGLSGLIYLTGGNVAVSIAKMNTYDAVANYFYCVIPFFLLMGFLVLQAGIGTKLYSTGSKLFGRLPGGLAIGTVFGCAGFAAICGESVASAATMGSVSIPEMKRFNYDDSLATGSVAAGGTLGILIPPSIGFIVYGIITEESIGKLFMAGIIPGIILTLGFALAIYIQCRINPALGPKAPKASVAEMVLSMKDVWHVGVLFLVVIGGIYSGIITPTEAGGVGAIGALIIAVFAREFTWNKFFAALRQATQMSAMIFTILIGVSLLGYFIALTDIPLNFANYLKSLDVSRYVIFVMILGLYLVLGMLMNIIPMMMLTLPILYPTVIALGFHPIWFGVIMVIMMEMGQISPPIGLNVFVIHGVAKKFDIPMATIFRGIIPFVIVEVLVIILLTIFPEIVLLLPEGMDVLAPIG
ncbi:TRAP transporter large permease subunit [bacterium]|nr:TRAP transporter large permease subunit [bacterium]